MIDEELRNLSGSTARRILVTLVIGECGLERLDPDFLNEAFKKLFAIDNFESVMGRVFDAMREKKLIELEYSNGGEKPVPHLALQPRSHQLWEMLGDNALVLEMFRDDTYQVFQGRPKKLSTAMTSEDLFEDVFNWLLSNICG